MAKSAFRRKYQRLLTKSYYVLVLAVRGVTQDNSEKKTAGVDGIKNLPPMQGFNLVDLLNSRHLKASPTCRVSIPKPGKDEKRPLGIPTMYDRALQALVLGAEKLVSAPNDFHPLPKVRQWLVDTQLEKEPGFPKFNKKGKKDSFSARMKYQNYLRYI